MFSEKKIQLAQQEIDFLGMKFSQGSYQPQPHIAEELLNFPEENLSVKQIQQFLGIINYIRDFIPKVARYTSPLSKLLKKNPPPWGPEQTKAVQEIKKIAQNPPALKIPGEGKRILQTDASDHYWGAVFIEEIDGKRFYYGHASGQFKEAEKHYHTTYKEALALKNGIKKFDFHLRGYHFEVQMDNSSFPKILDFKNKLPPEPQLLRLKDWFSRYDFIVKHIKGKHNLIPDFLSRSQKPVLIISSSYSFPLIFMAKPLPDTAKTRKLYPPGFKPNSPEEIIQFARSHYFYYLHETLRFKVVPPTMFDPTEEHPGIFELSLLFA
uniref:Polyprotein n=1 Tax=Cajanus cajan TaxID=3821 RepID=A0A151SLB4_CAJCA|nr:polyprotein [Cajanus cajan]